MSALNPFDKEGKPNATFADRIVIMVLFVVFALLAVMMPFLLIGWYKKAGPVGKALFWFWFIILMIAGAAYHSWLYSG